MAKIRLAGVIIVDKQGRILLLHRATKKRTQWEIPGGKIEDTEHADVAAAREANEELAVDVKIIRELGARDFSEDGHTMSYAWFLGEALDSPKIGEPDKFDDLRFWSIDDLVTTNEPISPNTQNFVKEIQNGKVELQNNIYAKMLV
jgi:ADP-ribose pyrophosphatase YjhB (NUDIX family)